MSLTPKQMKQLDNLYQHTIYPALGEDIDFQDVDQAFEGIQYLITKLKGLPLKTIVNQDE